MSKKQMIGHTHTLPQAGAIIGHLIEFNVDLEDYDLSKMPQVCYKKLWIGRIMLLKLKVECDDRIMIQIAMS